jgi:hypothetical protein
MNVAHLLTPLLNQYIRLQCPKCQGQFQINQLFLPPYRKVFCPFCGFISEQTSFLNEGDMEKMLIMAQAKMVVACYYAEKDRNQENTRSGSLDPSIFLYNRND